jgi:hypothetical protein
MEKGIFMKRYLTATAALLALSAHAQLSGPNRTGVGTSPGTFQTPGSTASSIEVTTPDSSAIRVAPPIANPRVGPVPRTSLGTPDATAGTLAESLRNRSAFPSSRDWETGVGAPPATEVGSDSRRLTPPPSTINPNLPPITGSSTAISGSTTAPGSTRVTPPISGTGGAASTTTTPALRSDLNTTGVNTPPRTDEQPLDKALSAKIRAQLSQTQNRASARLAPEVVRDMRITSQGGKVILEGNVSSAAEMRMVEMEARRVPGVVAVENRLTVRNRNAGAPAAGQIGQSPRNTSDLNDDHPALSPEIDK